MPFPGVGFSFLLMDLFRHLVGLLGRGGQSSAKASTYTQDDKHRETQTHIHAPSRIRTCDLNVRATGGSTVSANQTGKYRSS
jgi:hypothetical protein